MIVITGLLALILLLGCRDVEFEMDPTPIQGTYRISANIESDDTRVIIDGTEVRWRKGDIMTIAEVDDVEGFARFMRFKIDDSSISTDGKTADFYGEELIVGKKYLAVTGSGPYLIDADNFDEWMRPYNKCLYLSQDCSKQSESDDTQHFAGYGWTMKSDIFEATSASFQQLKFQNQQSILRLNLTLDDSSQSECKLSQVGIYSNPLLMSNSVLFDTDGNMVFMPFAHSSTIWIDIDNEPIIDRFKNYIANIPIYCDEKALEVLDDFVITIITTDGRESIVTYPARALTSGKIYNANVSLPEPKDMIENDRQALIAFYKATDGDNWNDNTNWCTDKPLSEWKGVSTYMEGIYSGRVSGVYGAHNNLSGSIPPEFWKLSRLNSIELGYNNLTSSLPPEIGDLRYLYKLGMRRNKLTGTIPPEIEKLKRLGDVDISYNYIEGPIPEALMKNKNWTSYMIDFVINQIGYTIIPHGDYGKLRQLNATTLDFEKINTHDVFRKNKYTIIYSYDIDCIFSQIYNPVITDLYARYADKGLGVITFHAILDYDIESKMSRIKEFVAENGFENFVNFFTTGMTEGKYGGTKWEDSYFFNSLGTPSVEVVDSEGRLVYGLANDRNKLPTFIELMLD